MERFAVVLRANPGQEAAYGEWLVQSGDRLGEIYARHGVEAKTVLTAGRRFIAHYEGEGKESVANALADPELHEIARSELSGILEADEADAPLHEEIFAWSAPHEGPAERAGLVLTIREGQEAAYGEWLASPVLEELVRIWNRNEIYRHDVLAAGTDLVAFYECKSRFNVLKAFREPEALAMLLGQLSAILDLDPHTPLSLFQEAYSWRRARERQPA